MDILEVKNLWNEIAKLEERGWQFTPISGDTLQVTYPNVYLARLGLEPKADVYFSTWWNAVCWCKGFTAACQMTE